MIFGGLTPDPAKSQWITSSRLAIPRVALQAKPNEQISVEWLHAAKAASCWSEREIWKIQSQH